ncbi:MAG: oligopeptide ABC transporter ATP-binding protein [Spirochaetes bacterium]|nr:MAG: oligopeptide ABC transporter ATP-binding protein [Spirochaetota bacterium]
MGEVIETRELKVYFFLRRSLFRQRAVKAVDGVSLRIERGETLALVGESGSGKTTLGRALLRLVELRDGVVLFRGRDITGLKGKGLKSFRRSAQAIFQDPYSSISPYMNIYDIVSEPLLIHRVKEKEKREKMLFRALEQVNLLPVREILYKYPHNLSGGQRQRVSIARAMVLEPEFVVADEPVSMVDASNRAEILYLLRNLQKEKSITFLYITHDLASARHFSDRIAVMYLGTIVETGITGRVIEEPLHPYTRGLLASVPEPDPLNRKKLRPLIPGEPPSASDVPSGCPFHPRCSDFIERLCDKARPSLKELSPERSVACHLF